MSKGLLENVMVKLIDAVEAERKDCYGSISDLNFCSNMLGSNVTKEQCCCTIGAGWGDDCDLMVCPTQGSGKHIK